MPERSHALINSLAPTLSRDVRGRLAPHLQKVWLQVEPWLGATIVASAVPWLLLLGLWWLTDALVQPVDDWGPRFITFGQPLDPESRFFVWATGISYGIVGMLLCLRNRPRARDWRFVLSWWLLALAVAWLLFSGPLLSTTWSLAARHGDVPAGPSGVVDGNHGPWRWVHTMDSLLRAAFALPFHAFVVALFSRVLRRQPAFSWVAGGCFVVFFWLICSHYWLVD